MNRIDLCGASLSRGEFALLTNSIGGSGHGLSSEVGEAHTRDNARQEQTQAIQRNGTANVDQTVKIDFVIGESCSELNP